MSRQKELGKKFFGSNISVLIVTHVDAVIDQYVDWSEEFTA
jgi:hypothetical protein